MKKYIFLTILASFVACANNAQTSVNTPKDAKPQIKLKAGEYQIEKIIDKNTNLELTGNGWSIVIDEKHFGMYVGCNRIFGSINQINSKLNFQNIESTKMTCPEDQVEYLVNKNLKSLDIIKHGLENENIKIIFK